MKFLKMKNQLSANSKKKKLFIILIIILFISLNELFLFYMKNLNSKINFLIPNDDLNLSGDQSTLINGSSDFFRVEINISVMESVNLTFIYADALTNQTIPDLDNQTYNWQKLNEQGEVINRGEGILITALDNSTILDMDTEFLSLGYYVILVYLNKNNYEPKNAIVDMHIINRPTLINDKENLEVINKSIYLGESINFTFTYKDKLTGIKLTDLNETMYIWEYYAPCNITDNGQGLLELTINKTYVLDFDTEDKGAGNYTIQVFFSKTNYTSQTVLINLTINERSFMYVLGDDFKENKISIVKGQKVLILINLTDPTNELVPIINASVILIIDGIIYSFEETEEGIYEYEFNTNKFNTFFEPKTLVGNIKIIKEGYKSESFEIEIIIKMQEIFPGMPIFYFLNIIIPLFIILLGLFFYRRYKLKRT